jgi:ribosomal protein S18 acetylase RimI-like enzyme
MSETITFRDLRKTDVERCVEMTDESWPELKPIGLDFATIEWYGWPATWKMIACDADVAVGLLFGMVHGESGALHSLKTKLDHATVYLKMLLGIYGKIPHKLSYLMGGLIGDRDIGKYSPEVDGEITFFVVDSRYRGRGIGKELLNRFVAHAKEKGARNIAVYTNEPGSDLAFYERRGFTKYSTFRDGFMSVVRNEDVKAMFYVLKIDSNQKYPSGKSG